LKETFALLLQQRVKKTGKELIIYPVICPLQGQGLKNCVFTESGTYFQAVALPTELPVQIENWVFVSWNLATHPACGIALPTELPVQKKNWVIESFNFATHPAGGNAIPCLPDFGSSYLFRNHTKLS